MLNWLIKIHKKSQSEFDDIVRESLPEIKWPSGQLYWQMSLNNALKKSEGRPEQVAEEWLQKRIPVEIKTNDFMNDVNNYVNDYIKALQGFKYIPPSENWSDTLNSN